MLLQPLSQRTSRGLRILRMTQGDTPHSALLLERASQFDRNVFATLDFRNEFSMRSFIDSPCEN